MIRLRRQNKAATLKELFIWTCLIFFANIYVTIAVRTAWQSFNSANFDLSLQWNHCSLRFPTAPEHSHMCIELIHSID